MIAHPVHDDAALVLEKLGGDASDFAARQLTSRIAYDADLILTMTRVNIATLCSNSLRANSTELSCSAKHPDSPLCATRKISQSWRTCAPTVGAYELTDIRDPIGRSVEFSSTVGSQTANLLPPVLELCRRSSGLAAD